MYILTKLNCVGRGKKGSHKRQRERDGSGDQGKNAFGEDETPRVKRENSAADGGARRAYDMVSANSRRTRNNGVLGLESNLPS